MEASSRPRAVFMAFGTKGDVLPIAAIASALAHDQQHYSVVLITHAAHQDLGTHMEAINFSFVPVSTPPVVPFSTDDANSGSESLLFSLQKKKIQEEHRQECLSAVGRIFGDGPTMEGDFIMINFFALEGWSLAELFQLRCIVAAPYVVPYSAPSSFQRRFKQELPLMYRYFQEAPANKVSWKDVVHWMWPLFTDDWASWRTESLNIGPFPYMDPVTSLPMWHIRAESPLLLYGFSKEIVEYPDYWPPNAHVCGFWFQPMEWQFSCCKCSEIMSLNSSKCLSGRMELCEDHADLEHFLLKTSSLCLPIFVGLSSTGSMGFLQDPQAFLLVLKAVVEMTNHRFILFSAGYKPLDDAIQSIADASLSLNDRQLFTHSKDCFLLFNDRIFCFSGSIPYGWLFPRCSLAVHHGGRYPLKRPCVFDKSGSSAAALRAGIPQILCPFLLDQFYWAERLYWLGVAPEPLQRQYLIPDRDDVTSIERAANALTKAIRLASSPELKTQASRIAERISSEDGIGEALKVLKEEIIYPRSTQCKIGIS